MSGLVIGLALFAAVLHATWNAFLRTGADRLWTVTIMSFSSTVVAAPMALLSPGPSPTAWPYVALSAGLQVGYSFFLAAAYRYGELGQVYPVVRGTVPLLVALGGFLLVGQELSLAQVAGVALVAVGIMSLSLGRRRATPASLGFALVTGVFIAGYATVDAIGVRLARSATGYTAWVLLVYGALLPSVFVLCRGRLVFEVGSAETRKALAGGLIALVGYGVVVAAFSLGPAGPITALRETSVVFAALIGWAFLGEALTSERIVACAVVATGAVFIGYR